MKMMEPITTVEYDAFKILMDRIAEHPYAFRVKDFLFEYRRTLMNKKITMDVPKPHLDENGRFFITVYGKSQFPSKKFPN